VPLDFTSGLRWVVSATERRLRPNGDSPTLIAKCACRVHVRNSDWIEVTNFGAKSLISFGGRTRTRTLDPLIRRPFVL
jgi:hypothetical protein